MNDEDLTWNIKWARNKETITIYFAHTLKLRDVVAKEIIPFFDIDGYKIINPFAKRLEELSKYGENEEKLRKELKSPPRWIVMHDLADINKCDAVIVYNPTGASYGTIFEASYAWLIRKIPVFFVVEEKYLHHPWLGFIGHMVVTTEQLMDLRDKLDQLFER